VGALLDLFTTIHIRKYLKMRFHNSSCGCLRRLLTVATFVFFLTDLVLTASVAAETLDVRLMTFNIRYGTAEDGVNRWEKRRDLVCDVLRQEDCDVIGLQEALKFQLDVILKEMPRYKFVGVGRDDGKEAGEFAPILYRHDRFEVLESSTFWLSDSPDVPGSGSWEGEDVRICTWARLQEKGTWKTFYVYNTHLSAQSASARFHAVELIASRIAKRAYDDPVVLLGDLNATEKSNPMRFLRGEISGPTIPRTLAFGWVDTFRQLHPEAKRVGTFNGFIGDRKGPKIDYVLASAERTYVLEAYILDWNKAARYPSDHFPIVVRVLLGASRIG